MKTGSILKLAVTGSMIVALAGCSIIRNQRAEKDRLTEEDRAGRITMVLGDDAIEAEPALAGTTVTLPPAAPVTGWTQAGSQATKTAGHIAAGADFQIAWRADAGDGSDKRSALTAPPVANADTVFVIDSRQTVRAFDATSGSRRWSRDLDSGNRRDKISTGGGLAVAGEKLIVSSGFGFVSALSTSDGREIWRIDMEAPMTGSPTVKDNRVFVSSNNNEIFALNLETGDILWSDQAIAESARVLGSPSAAAVEDIVIAPFSSGEVIAYLAANGRRLWTEALASPGRFTPISSINDIASRPVIGGGVVFAASQSGVLVSIDGRTGTRVWVQPIGSTQAPAVVGDYLFVMGVNGRLACISAASGQVFWVSDLPRYEKEEKKKGRISYSGPIIASNRVVVASSEGDLLGYSPQTGEQVSRLKIGQPIFIEPIAVQDKLIILTDEGRLVAVR